MNETLRSLLPEFGLTGDRFSPDGAWLPPEAAPPSILSNVIRAKLHQLELTAKETIESDDESPEWRRSAEDALAMACHWMFDGFTKVLRRGSETRSMRGVKSMERIVPLVDLPRFRDAFGFTQGATFQQDCAYLSQNMHKVWDRMDRFASEFMVMFADFDRAIVTGNVVHSGWRDAMDAPVTTIRRLPYRIWKPEQIRLECLGGIPSSGQSAPAVTATILKPAPSVETPKPAVDPVQEKLDELSRQVEDLQAQLQREREEGVASQFRDLVKSLRGRIHYLESRPEPEARPEQAPETLPSTWEAMPVFAANRLGGRVVITRRAYRAIKTSVFRNIPFVYEVLLMLAEDYVPMRRGEEGARERFERSCRMLRVTVTNTGEAVDAHRTTEAYRVNHLGKRLPLDMHVRGNSHRDPREGFRLYFNYYAEDDDGVVVVGHLPSHLDSTLS